MYRLVQNRSAAAGDIHRWRYDPIGTICSAGAIWKWGKDGIIVGFERQEGWWRGICGVFGGNLLAKNVVI